MVYYIGRLSGFNKKIKNYFEKNMLREVLSVNKKN